jgi:hypothetical protein
MAVEQARGMTVVQPHLSALRELTAPQVVELRMCMRIRCQERNQMEDMQSMPKPEIWDMKAAGRHIRMVLVVAVVPVRSVMELLGQTTQIRAKVAMACLVKSQVPRFTTAEEALDIAKVLPRLAVSVVAARAWQTVRRRLVRTALAAVVAVAHLVVAAS